MPVHDQGYPEPRGLQLWVDLPKQYKMVEPSYQELGPDKYVSSFTMRLERTDYLHLGFRLLIQKVLRDR